MSDEWTCTEIEYMEHDGVEVQTWTHNGVEVYSAGKMVTYMVDSGISYQEKVKKGQSCLAPTTFTPSKSGWTFAGWREDSTASGSVLSEKVMERSPITLCLSRQSPCLITATERRAAARLHRAVHGITTMEASTIRHLPFGATDLEERIIISKNGHSTALEVLNTVPEPA